MGHLQRGNCGGRSATSRTDSVKAPPPYPAQTRSQAHAAKKKGTPKKPKHMCPVGFEEVANGSSEAMFQVLIKRFRLKRKKPKTTAHKKDFVYYKPNLQL